MNMSSFFIDRPIFASVIALFITLLGAFAYPALPLAQYPEIAPPSVAVTAAFPGASAETMAETIAAPIEQEINGVEGMLYMRSNSSQGLTAITVTFQPGTDIDTAQVLVQNRVALAEPRLPDQVRQIGVTVNKQSSDFLMVAAMTSTDPSVDIDYVGNYANSTIRDRLLRLPGVGAVQVFGGGNYSMRIWIDPDAAAARNLTSEEIVGALRGQNVQVAGGSVGQAPLRRGGASFELPVQVQGRLNDPNEFADVVLKTDTASGAITRLRDVARVEIGSQDYSIRGTSGTRAAVFMAIQQLPGSNALDTAEGVLSSLEAASRSFPPGVEYSIPVQPDRICPGVGERGPAHADRSHHSGGARDRPLPADMARGDHPDHRDPGVAGRHVRGPARSRLLDQFALALRTGSCRRHRRRRRHRGRRGGREAHPRRLISARGGASHDAGDFGRADRDRPRPRGRVRAGRPHLGNSGHLLSPVRRHHRGGGGNLDDHFTHAIARARRLAAQAAFDRRGLCRGTAQLDAHDQVDGRPFQQGLRLGVRPLWVADRQAGASLDAHAGHLRRSARPHRLAAERHADRIHSGPGPGLPDRRHPASARLLAGTDGGRRRGYPQGRLAERDDPRDGRLRRSRRIDLQPRLEQRHHVPAPRRP